jgi:hypothetical protein
MICNDVRYKVNNRRVTDIAEEERVNGHSRRRFLQSLPVTDFKPEAVNVMGDSLLVEANHEEKN